MKKLSWRWKVLVFFVLLLPLEQWRKRVFIVGYWRATDGNAIKRRVYEPGGRGTLRYHDSEIVDEIVEEYKVRMAFFLDGQILISQGEIYPPPGSRINPENGHYINRLNIILSGNRMSLCSKSGCARYERYDPAKVPDIPSAMFPSVTLPGKK